MFDIKFIEKVSNNPKFIKKYIQSKNLNLDYEKVEVKVCELANGEYNYNYLLNIRIVYREKTINSKAVFRINYGSQMNLKNQVEYEFNALCYLKDTGVTPFPIFMDTSKRIFPKDFIIMEYIEGTKLDYEKDLEKAAMCLAKIHKYKAKSKYSFVEPKDPFEAIFDECSVMYEKYRNSRLFNIEVDIRVKTIFEILKNKLKSNEEKNILPKTLINTELNSSNFIVDGNSCHLVDWEKPIIADVEQDLGHFLAPTTTFWKTEVILSKVKIDDFLSLYYNIYKEGNADYSSIEFINFKARVYKYIAFNCLRGITWCAMAWVEYNSCQKEIINTFTFNKLKDYLNVDFIDNIIENFL